MTETIFKRTNALREVPTHYCPGCTHGIVHRMVCEVIEEIGMREKAVGIAPVGCSVLAYNYFNFDSIQAAHGRAPAVATGVKRGRPKLLVFTYQGDGDLASIGTAEIIHAANRGEKITVIFINNAIYGMTGGQMAPTTLPGQVTSTCPFGRDVAQVGYPIRVCEMLNTLATPAFIARVAVHTPKHIIMAKKAIRKAFTLQKEGKCFTFVELLSTCPTNWGLTPEKGAQWLDSDMKPFFKIGVFKNPEQFED